MSADVPHTLYLKDKGNETHYDNSRYTKEQVEAMNKEAIRLNQQTTEWLKESARKRHKEEQWESISIEDVLKEH